MRVTAAFLPLLRKSDAPRLVMVSSGIGSFAITTDPGRIESTLHGLVYPSSKAALNMVTSQYAKALRTQKSSEQGMSWGKKLGGDYVGRAPHHGRERRHRGAGKRALRQAAAGPRGDRQVHHEPSVARRDL